MVGAPVNVATRDDATGAIPWPPAPVTPVVLEEPCVLGVEGDADRFSDSLQKTTSC